MHRLPKTIRKPQANSRGILLGALMLVGGYAIMRSMRARAAVPSDPGV